MILLLLSLLLGSASLASTQVQAGPATGAFADVELGEALGRPGLVVAFFSAESCGPCQLMHALTWTDARLVAWLRGNTTTVEVDVEALPWAATAYAVEGTPQVLAFRDGDELGRLAGFHAAEQVLAFLEAMREGRTYPPPAESEDDLVALAQEDCSALMRRATHALMLGRLDESQRIASFCWRRALEFEPALAGGRGSLLLMTIGHLVQVHAPAREEFFELLVQTEVEVRRGSQDGSTWGDLFALAKTLRETERAVAALRFVLDERGLLPAAPEIVDAAHEFLWSAGEPVLAGSIVDDLGLHAEYVLLQRLERRRDDDPLPLRWAGAKTAARYYGSALRAGQDDAATRIASFALQSFEHEQTRLLLVEAALVGGAGRPEHLEWLRVDGSHGSELVRYRAGVMERYLRRHLDGQALPLFRPHWDAEATLLGARR